MSTTIARSEPPWEEATRRLVAELEPERIILFGSHAWGSPNEDSDLASTDEPKIGPTKLPRADRAVIPPEKLTDYLLSMTHPVGSAKAGFFRGHGFNDDNSELLADGLLQIARSQNIHGTSETPFGVKYVVDGPLQTPAGPLVRIRTVWIIETGQTDPRFVTALPR